MQHRDKIILDKIIDEVNIATKMLSDINKTILYPMIY